MTPTLQQARITAMRDNEVIALVVLPSGEVLAFSEPLELPAHVEADDTLAAAVVGLTAQINLIMLRNL